MSVTLTLNGDQPVTFSGYALNGYHRPLNGEAANLTIALQPDAVWAEWLENPSLGVACSVDYDDERVMDGFVYSVKAGNAAIEIGVEG